jgi:hypothetical protein
MQRVMVVVLAMALAVAACGGDDAAGDAERPPASAAWQALDADVRALAERSSILVAEVDDDGSLSAIHERDADDIAPLGSIFKLYVLGALIESIDAGEHTWDEELTVEEGDLSISGGPQTQLGAALRLQELATLMIWPSDNHATDLIIRTLGRDAVEAMLEPMGMGAASRARTLPFLTAREAFIVKWGARAADYAPADEAGRRTILSEVADEPVPNPFSIDQTRPTEIDRVEWFATAEEVAAAHLWLDAARTRPGADELDQVLDQLGLDLDRTVWPRGAFKGGSEPGILSLSWLLERRDGRRFVVVMQMSSTAKPIPDADGAEVAQRTIDLVAEVP